MKNNVILITAVLLIASSSLFAQSEEEIFGKGLNAYNRGDYNEAIEFFTKAIEQDSMNHIFWFNRGTCYVKTRDYDRAEFDLMRSLKLDPYANNVAMQLAVVLAETGRAEQAILLMDQVIETDSTFPMAHLLRGRLRLTAGIDSVGACEDLHMSEKKGNPTARKYMPPWCKERTAKP